MANAVAAVQAVGTDITIRTAARALRGLPTQVELAAAVQDRIIPQPSATGTQERQTAARAVMATKLPHIKAAAALVIQAVPVIILALVETVQADCSFFCVKVI